MDNSFDWIETICSKLFAAEYRRLNSRIEKLMERNNELRGKPSFGFIYMGKQYIPESMRRVANATRRKQALAPLAIQLMDEASSFARDADTIERDISEIRQLLFKLLVNCNTEQDLRNTLPDCIVNMFPELSSQNRTLDDPLHFIQHDWRAVRLYEKMLPRIEMYAMGHMLY